MPAKWSCARWPPCSAATCSPTRFPCCRRRCCRSRGPIAWWPARCWRSRCGARRRCTRLAHATGGAPSGSRWCWRWPCSAWRRCSRSRRCVHEPGRAERKPMKNSLRQAMAWLHTWSGLLAGWLLFVIFVGGTIACFDRELDDWARPSLHDLSGAQPTRFDAAFARVREQAPDAHVWWAHVSGERKRGMEAFWFNDDGSEGHVLLDPRDGGEIPASGPGQFFFELHYDLHAGRWGMYIVGFTGMLMLVALVAGVITHKKIFKDFFMLRWRGGGQRAWLDGHNLAGVLGLPFHLMIAYTGVAIFAASYIFGGTQAAYGGDVEKFYEEAGGFYERPEIGRPLQSLHSIDALV